MMNKKTILLGSTAVLAVSTFIFNSNRNVEKQYSEINKEEKASYSVQEERALIWQKMNANVITGKVERSDYMSSLNEINARPTKKAADFIELIEEGPDNVGGRTRGICVDIDDVNVIYAGSVSGGLFKSTNKGGDWHILKSFSENLSIMSMDMTSNGRLYIGTGGGILGESPGLLGTNQQSGNTGGDGLWYSDDNGISFSQVNGTAGQNISTVVAHPTENKIFYVGNGLGVKIYDGASVSSASGTSTDLSDIEISSDGNTLVCGQVDTYISTNGGTSFSKVSGAGQLETGWNARYAISHEKNDNNFYNIFASIPANSGYLAGIWMSPNGGTSWFEIGPGGSTAFTPFGQYGQGDYDNTITVIKGRPNEILVGGIDLWHWELTTSLSNPTGQWARVSQWNANESSVKYVHADQHEMKWDKDGNLYFGNDGGIFTFIQPFPEDVSYLSFKHLTRGYNTLQFYSLSHGVNGEVLAGAQDNGTQYNNHTGGTYGEAFEVSGGDGFDCEISTLDPDGQIASIYYTALSRSDDGGNTHASIPVIPCSGTPGGLDASCGDFFTKFELSETIYDGSSRDSVIFELINDTLIPDGESFEFSYASQNLSVLQDSVWENTFGKDSLLPSGTTFTVADHVQSLFVLSVPGEGVHITRDIWKYGVTTEWWEILNSSDGMSGDAVSFAFSKNQTYLYIGTTSGEIWRIDDIGDVYDELELGTLNKTLIYNGAQFISDLYVNPNNQEHVVASLGGYGASSNIIESTDAASTITTASFSSIQGNLPSMPVFSAIIDKDDPNYIIAGTAFGLWYTQDGGNTWNENNEALGKVPVFKVEQDTHEDNIGSEIEGAIYIATHGRGYWSTNGHLREPVAVEENKKENFKSEIQIFPNPVNEIANVTFDISSASKVSVNVVSIDGKIVRSSSLGEKPAGKHRMNVNTENLPKGIYIIQVMAGKSNKSAKFIKL